MASKGIKRLIVMSMHPLRKLSFMGL